MRAAVALVVLLAACGARSGLDVEAFGEPVAIDAGRRDGGLRDAGRDVGAPSACPPPSSFGYTIHELGAVDIGLRPVGELSLGGDGTSVVLGVSASEPGGIGMLVELGPMGEVLNRSSLLDMTHVRVAVEAGTLRAIATVSDAALVLLRGTVGSYDVSRTVVSRPPLVTLARPAWNGVDAVIAGQNGFEVFLGAFVPDVASPAWRSFGPAEDVDVAAQATSGITELLYRAGDRSLRIETFGRDSVMLEPPGVVALEEIGFLGRVAFGFLDDGTSQPYVLAGFANEAGETRATLRRFRADGTAAGGFSAPVDGVMLGGVDLSTVAPRGHRSGYGMVAGLLGAGIVFHGAGEDFVGDSRSVALPCDGVNVSIASGPCGYVIACTGGDALWLALGVPPLPR